MDEKDLANALRIALDEDEFTEDDEHEIVCSCGFLDALILKKAELLHETDNCEAS